MTRIRNQKKKDQNINTKDRKKPICNFLGSIEKRKRKKKTPYRQTYNYWVVDERRIGDRKVVVRAAGMGGGCCGGLICMAIWVDVKERSCFLYIYSKRENYILRSPIK